MFRKLIYLLGAIILFYNLPSQSVASQSGDNQPPIIIKPKPPTPTHVLMGVYPVSISEINLAHKTVKVSFYAWWRSTDSTYHPEKSVEITNALDYNLKVGGTGKNGDEYFTYVHYYATIQKDWDVRYFPFDHQKLEVRLEDFYDENYVVFDPDFKNSHLHNELSLPGWKIKGMELKKSTTFYNTNFGDSSLNNANYSRLSFVIDLKRVGWRSYFNYYVGFFVAFFLCCMIFFVDPGNINARASLSLGSIFTAVGNKYVIDQLLPFTADFTLSDAIQAATFCVITLAVLSFILLHELVQEFGRKKVIWINRILSMLCMFGYIIYVGLWTLLAILS
ncbi:hypothetical protein [Candidatus Nucleicultrix amoebiphila]|jgi:hypothetical protein|uniref:Neurotransmitter-gated ion-channel ligand-binding domain-containing protein n=1 Tax=Candidatus Nucleicultrix amoebiphila FS5 TaxID=1414854 RepID=A0A1W6N3B4_9PROT|nr:hypothetical protein [Candidatus Nucleicultrix amoebiphila]ARN84266.1 hypothetical protein GQ61_01735 [Candidatus Nucleicultrix amoebiphila FS5]